MLTNKTETGKMMAVPEKCLAFIEQPKNTNPALGALFFQRIWPTTRLCSNSDQIIKIYVVERDFLSGNGVQ